MEQPTHHEVPGPMTPFFLRWIATASLVVVCAPFALAQNSPPVVSNVVAQQTPNTGLVVITFDVSDLDGDLLAVSAICSSDNGTTFDLYLTSVAGDINKPVTPGSGKQIVWNAALDYPGRHWSQVVAKVVVSDGPMSAGEMVLVPAGPFTMGNDTPLDSYDSPAHTVQLDSFYIDKFEVTNAEYELFIEAGGYTTQAWWSPEGWQWRVANNVTQPAQWGDSLLHTGPDWPGFPIVNVTWYEAYAYARYAAKRLPTEAEWEKAARGPDGRLYPWGNTFDPSWGNYSNSGDPYSERTTPVGFFDGRLHPSPPFQTSNAVGPYGAYDQGGNVIEWVNDWLDSNYYQVSPSANPPGPLNGTAKVLRGGSFAMAGGSMRVTNRLFGGGVSQPGENVGFRCARWP